MCCSLGSCWPLSHASTCGLSHQFMETASFTLFMQSFENTNLCGLCCLTSLRATEAVWVGKAAHASHRLPRWQPRQAWTQSQRLGEHVLLGVSSTPACSRAGLLPLGSCLAMVIGALSCQILSELLACSGLCQHFGLAAASEQSRKRGRRSRLAGREDSSLEGVFICVVGPEL